MLALGNRISTLLAIAAALAAFVALPLLAQTRDATYSLPPSADVIAYTPTLTFDVTSVREAERGPALNMGIVSPPHSGRFEASSISLHILLQIAYGAGPFVISGGPEWVDDRYFHVEGKSDHSVDDQLAKLPEDQSRLEKLHMIQALLVDRFHLKAHWETREGSVFNMTAAKSGLKMQQTPAPPSEPTGPNGTPAAPASLATDVHAHGGPQGIEIDGAHFNMRAVTAMLATQIRKPIVDKTGLDGFYSFALQFSREGSTSPDAYPSIFTAVQEQLGLKLQSGKGPVDTLVIEHVELPSEN